MRERRVGAAAVSFLVVPKEVHVDDGKAPRRVELRTGHHPFAENDPDQNPLMDELEFALESLAVEPTPQSLSETDQRFYRCQCENSQGSWQVKCGEGWPKPWPDTPHHVPIGERGNAKVGLCCGAAKDIAVARCSMC